MGGPRERIFGEDRDPAGSSQDDKRKIITAEFDTIRERLAAATAALGVATRRLRRTSSLGTPPSNRAAVRVPAQPAPPSNPRPASSVGTRERQPHQKETPPELREFLRAGKVEAAIRDEINFYQWWITKTSSREKEGLRKLIATHMGDYTFTVARFGWEEYEILECIDTLFPESSAVTPMLKVKPLKRDTVHEFTLYEVMRGILV